MDKVQDSANRQKTSKLGIFLLMITVIVLFSVLGAVYMRSSHDLDLTLPNLFYLNSLFLLISSVFLHLGWGKKSDSQVKQMLGIALGIGFIFLFGQGFAWSQLYDQGIDLANSGQKASFLYLLTGLHAVHIIGGISFLSYVLICYEEKGKQYFESAMFFWHFLGLLWIYLICLLLV